MLSLGEIVVLAGAALFLLGRKEGKEVVFAGLRSASLSPLLTGVKMLKTSSRTVNKFWKELSKDAKSPAGKAKKKDISSKQVRRSVFGV